MKKSNVERCGYGFQTETEWDAHDERHGKSTKALLDPGAWETIIGTSGIARHLSSNGWDFVFTCQICGELCDLSNADWSPPSCSPSKHAAYYDSFDETRSRLLGGKA